MSCYIGSPNIALVRSGACQKESVFSIGGFFFIIPCFQRVDRLDLNVMSIEIDTPYVYTKEGVAISVRSSAQIKVSHVPELLQKAAGQFLGHDIEFIKKTARRTLEGHQRAIMGTLTVDEIYKDRQKFNHEVREIAAVDISNMGLEIISFTIKDVDDSEGYLNSLGKKRIAEVKRDASIGQAEAERDAVVKEAAAMKIQMDAKYSADTRIAESKKEYEIAQATFDVEVNAEKAKAKLSKDLQSAIVRQQIKSEEMQVTLVARQKQIEVEENEIARMQKVLESTIIKPTDAEKYGIEILAEAEKLKRQQEAEAEATKKRLIGLAEAKVTSTVGAAEAEAMSLKAKAAKEYTSAAFVEMLIDRVPEIIHQVSEPLNSMEKLVMVSSGKDAQVGAAKLTGEVGAVVAQLPPVIEGLTGVSLTKSMSRLSGVRPISASEKRV